MESYTRKPNCKCNECNKEIYRRPSQLEKGDVYCSTKCANVRNKKAHPCPVCKVEVYGRRNALTCSRTCSNIYRTGTKYKVGRPRDNAASLRVIRNEIIEERGGKCNRCSYAVVEILHLHHIIERSNGGTDDPSNLEVLCPNCHTLHHYVKKLNWIAKSELA